MRLKPELKGALFTLLGLALVVETGHTPSVSLGVDSPGLVQLQSQRLVRASSFWRQMNRVTNVLSKSL